MKKTEKHVRPLDEHDPWSMIPSDLFPDEFEKK